MDVTCKNGHSQTISDPTDASWEYTTRDEHGVVSVTFDDGHTEEIQHVKVINTARHITWKCAAPAPTDENPAALCGAVQEINEVL